MRRFKKLLGCLLTLACAATLASVQGEYPRPVSECVEETGPNTLVFLSYPKYYRTASGALEPVLTDLATSSDPVWDYEVIKGGSSVLCEPHQMKGKNK